MEINAKNVPEHPENPSTIEELPHISIEVATQSEPPDMLAPNDPLVLLPPGILIHSTGSEVEQAEAKANYDQVTAIQRRTGYPYELPHTPVLLDQVEGARHTVGAWARHLGFDVTGRLTPPEAVHFFADLPDGPDEEERQGYRSRRGVFVQNNGQESAPDTVSVLVHELIHDVSHQAVTTVEGQDPQLRLGYHYISRSGNRYFTAVNEAVTELATRHALAISEAALHEKIGLVFDARAAHYPEHIIVVDELIQQAASHTGYPSTELFRMLETGLLTGDWHGLKLLMRPMNERRIQEQDRGSFRRFITATAHNELYEGFINNGDQPKWLRVAQRMGADVIADELRNVRPWELV